MTNTPSDEEVQDFLLSCRYGELDEVKAFVERYGKEAVVSARDDRGNTALHMCCGNGHVDIIEYLLPQVPSSFLAQTNENGSPALHWAILNNHVAVVQLLVEVPEEQGGGLPLLKQKNASGRDAFLEALFGGEGKEETAGWIEGYLYRAEGGDEEGGEGGEVTSEEAGAKATPNGDEGEMKQLAERTEKVNMKDA